MRKIEKFNARNNIWESKEIKDIKRKDIFRIIDEDGKIVKDPVSGDDVYLAASDGYLDDENEWAIKTI